MLREDHWTRLSHPSEWMGHDVMVAPPASASREIPSPAKAVCKIAKDIQRLSCDELYRKTIRCIPNRH